MWIGLVSWVPDVVGPVLAAGIVALVLGRWLQRSVAFAVGCTVTLLAAGLLALFGALSFDRALVVTMVLIGALSLSVVYRLADERRRWGQRVRSRFVMGLPWGTLIVVGFVLSVYLFLQGGLQHWYDPLTIPFRAWSYLYPLGILAAPFSHNGPGHLVGNLTATLVLGTVAEFAWGHFPEERGTTSFQSWRHNPYVRAFLVFPLVVVGVGLLTSALAMGPVIGFSGVVFAFAGFAITRYPLWTVVAAVGFEAAQTIYYAIRQPMVVATAQPSPPSAPWWAQVAIQGHGLGLLIGVILGWYVFVRRSDSPSPVRVWAGVFLFGMQQSLWAVYWFRGSERFVLFRGHGIVLVTVLALLVTVALTATNRTLSWDRVSRSRPGVSLGRSVETDGGQGKRSDEDGTDGDGWGWLTSRNVAVGLLVLGLWLVAIPGIGSNVFAAASFDSPETGVEVGDYTVFYAEDVTNEMVAIVDISFFNQTTQIRTSGVIVTSSERRIWQQAISKGRLAFLGSGSVTVGGVGWRRSVGVRRRGWIATGGGTVYKVWLRPPDGSERLAFRSDAVTAQATIDGRNVSIAPGTDQFTIVVRRNNQTLGRAVVPEKNDDARAGGLQFINRGGTLYAVHNRTIVQVAQKETYDHG